MEEVETQWGVQGDYKQPVTLPLSALTGGNACV